MEYWTCCCDWVVEPTCGFGCGCGPPADGCGVFCGPWGSAQLVFADCTMGLVLIAGCRAWGDGLDSRDSIDVTRHFRSETNCLILLIKYNKQAIVVTEIPMNVRNKINHRFASSLNSCSAFSVLRFSNPLHPSTAVFNESFQIK